MLYTILIYASEGVFDQLPPEEQQAVLAKHGAMQDRLESDGRLGPFAKLMGTGSAVTLRGAGGTDDDTMIVTDGPYAETKEQLLGFYLIECDTMEEAIEATKLLPQNTATYEIRPASWTHLDREREIAERNE